MPKTLSINMGTLEIAAVGVALGIVALSQIFQYLIYIKKLKPSKLTRLFYCDDENFIECWKKTQVKGMFVYIIKNIITMTVMIGIISIVLTYYRSYKQPQTLLVTLLLGIILGIINSLIGWSVSQDRFSKLKEMKGTDRHGKA